MPNQAITDKPAPRSTKPAEPAHLRRYLAGGYALLIVYASLSPFTGWRNQGLNFAEVLTAPLWQTFTPFDAAVNLLAYLPFGLLLGLLLRRALGATWSVLLATLTGMLLSALMEYVQMYLPVRTSSNFDLLTNSSGALAGALLAAAIAPSAWFARLGQWRESLFHSGGSVDFGLALAALWIFAQVNPSLPMLGNAFISETAHQPFVPPQPASFSWLKSTASALNLLMLGALLLTLLRQRRDAVIALMLLLCTVALAKFIAAVLLLKSWALLLWLDSAAPLGIFIGLLLLSAGLWLPRNAMLALTALAALGYLSLGFFAQDSNGPAAARPLLHWHYGHLLNYIGLSQTIMLLFPLLLLGYLWRLRSE